MAKANDKSSPISDEAYNVITALQSKLEGLAAYRKYSEAGQTDLWHELSAQELQSLPLLLTELERLVQEGHFRLRTSDRAA